MKQRLIKKKKVNMYQYLRGNRTMDEYGDKEDKNDIEDNK